MWVDRMANESECLHFIDEFDKPVWGGAAISRLINRSERATYHLFEKGDLDADKVGGRLVSTLRRLLRQFGGGGNAGNSHAPKQ